MKKIYKGNGNDLLLYNILQNIKKQEENKNKEEVKIKQEINLNKFKVSENQYKFLCDVMNGKNIFLTGNAGTGKSYLLQIMIKELRKKFNNNKFLETVYVTASTGCASININGCTINAFSGIGSGQSDKKILYERISKNEKCLHRWKIAKVLILDEISMVCGEIISKLDYIGKKIRESDKPFGGIQVIFSGDFYQLPPVFSEEFKQFAFESEKWNKIIDKNCVLTENFRQKGDLQYQSILNEIKKGNLSKESEKILNTRLKSNLKKEEYFNESYIMLFSHKKDVEKKNKIEYEKINEKEEVFEATLNNVNDKEFVSNWCNAPISLKLKKKCRVMLLINLSFELGLINGSIGFVESFEEKLKNPIIKFDNGVTYEIEKKEFKLEIGNEIISSLKQIPLMLCYAITIHKSQGITVPRLEVSLKKSFEYGMIYVALSRVTSLKGLIINDFDKEKITVNPKVVEFYKSIK